jgi:uncharacterized protein (TIGR02118 family)
MREDPGMYRVSILYPKTDGTTFDHEYYRSTHMPMVASKLGATCQSFSVDKVVDGDFEAIGYLVVDDLAAFGAKMAENGAEIMGDVPNYTAITPQMVVSEIAL